MKKEEHNSIPLSNNLFAIAWDSRCEECKNGVKHFAKEYTKEEIEKLPMPTPDNKRTKNIVRSALNAQREEIINELGSNPNDDGSISPNIQHWIEHKQMQLRKKFLLSNNKDL